MAELPTQSAGTVETIVPTRVTCESTKRIGTVHTVDYGMLRMEHDGTAHPGSAGHFDEAIVLLHRLTPARVVLSDDRTAIVATAPARPRAHPLELLALSALGVHVGSAMNWLAGTRDWTHLPPRPRSFDLRLSCLREGRLTASIDIVQGHATWRDGEIVIAEDMPPSVVQHLPGRPLADVVSMRRLDAIPLVIRAARSSALGTHLTLCPDDECDPIPDALPTTVPQG